jgi:pimeloyl-ACP methyl ester carboxylesterase
MVMAAVNGAQLAYDDSDPDGVHDAVPVILAHGFLMDRSMFAPQVEALSGSRRVITWDERGFGETVYDGEPFTYWDSAADCLGLLDHLGIERAVIGGMSQGGFVSLRAALTAPERVHGLLLFDTQAGPEDPEVIPLYQAMIDDWVANGPSDELAATVAGIIIGDPVESAKWIAKWQARPHAGLAQPGHTLMTRDSVEDRLGEITAPALVVQGTEDAAISMDKAQALADGLPACEALVAVDGAAHAANLTHPDAVNPAVLGFLGGL